MKYLQLAHDRSSVREVSASADRQARIYSSQRRRTCGSSPNTATGLSWLGILVTCFTASCSGSDQGTGPGAGGSQAGGTQGSGGSGVAIGGSAATGGAVAAGGNGGSTPGGTASTGGTNAAGGTRNTGGAAATGGMNVTGGAATVGGNPSIGGIAATGGSTSVGGSNATGGTKAAGGTVNTGGSKATGGSISSGGTILTGGTKATGGTTSTGGTKSTGGTTSTGGAKATGGTAAAGGSTRQGVWRIVPLGDSITGTTCYPQLLSKNLISGGHTNFVFVGSITNNQSCGSNAPSVKSEGHTGYLVTDLVGSGAHASELQPWCAANQADMVFMHFGTNNVWGGQRTTAQVLSAYTTVVADLRAVKPNVVLFVAQIVPLNPSTCTTCDYSAALDALIPAWAAGLSTSASPIYVVDLHSVFNPASIYVPNSNYTTDGVHPTPTGAQMMADKMYTAVVAQGYF